MLELKLKLLFALSDLSDFLKVIRLLKGNSLLKLLVYSLEVVSLSLDL